MTNIYQDIAERTNGDIYIGVVGPVRTGKSTFVTQFTEKLVLPNIKDKNSKKRTVDELPQAADGKIIMTTQPKFVPNEAVKITLSDKAQANVRLIDCVGYLVDGAEGHLEGDKARLVKTPWSQEPMPFEQAAEIGTQKVVSEHSTIAVVVTNDGSVTDIPRKNYLSAEERVVRELKTLGKPFIVLLNSRNPSAAETVSLAEALEEKYGVTVMPIDIANADKSRMEEVLGNILREFPVRRMCIDLPRWMRTLAKDNRLISGILERVKNSCQQIDKMKDAEKLIDGFEENEDTELPAVKSLEMGKGEVHYTVEAKPQLFFKVLSEEAGMDITDEYSLMSFVTASAFAKQRYDGIKDALMQAEENGYGVVCPSTEKMKLEDPEIVKQGSRFGVRLKATAPSYHIMKIDVATEVSPMVGTEQQSQYLLSEFQQNPQAIWETNMFGKTMSGLAQEGLSEKCAAMPQEMQDKLVRTVGKIINEGRGGLICLLL